MKKLVVAVIAAVFVLGLIANVAVAEDRLSLSGAVRVRVFQEKNFNFDTDTDKDNNQYWDQRFRIQGVIMPADGVKGVFRVDLAENTWGNNSWMGSRFGAGTSGLRTDSKGNVYDGSDLSSSDAGELQVDRAYIDVTKSIVQVKAGLMYQGLGNNYAYDANTTGLTIAIKTPLVITLGYAKKDEDQTHVNTYPQPTNLNDETGNEDIDHYWINLGFKNDALAVNAFYAMQTDGRNAADVGVDLDGDGVLDIVTGTDPKDEPTLLGVSGKFAVGPVNIFAEADMFGGDSKSLTTTTDYTGLQLIVDASMKLSDVVTLGVQGIYSDGNDKTDEKKITRMPNAFFGSLYYANYGAFAPDAPNILGSGDVMDPLGTQAGAMGGGVYASIKPIDALTLTGNFLYLVGSEDSVDGMFDKGYVFGFSAQYMLVQNCTVALGYTYADVDKIDANGDGLPETDNASSIQGRLQINF